VGAAKDGIILLDAMPNYPTAAMIAQRGESMDCTFKAVEGVLVSVHCHLEGLVILVAACFASGHLTPQ
jgi:hypothetical protein